MKLTLTDKRQETADVFSFYFEPQEPFKWKPGQFLFYTLNHPDPDERGVERYFTISTAPHESHVGITTRVTQSSFKQALNRMSKGETIQAKDLDGDFLLHQPSEEYVFVAGGIGIVYI